MFSDNSVNSKRVLYTPSPFAKETLLYLQETGTLTALKTHTSSRKGLQSFLFFTVLDGCGFLTYNGTQYSLKTGDCVFINCDKPYSHTTSEQLWTLNWAHFHGVAAQKIYNKYVERGGLPVFHTDNIDLFSDTLRQLYKCALSQDYIRDMRINEILSSLVTKIMEMSWQPEKKIEQKRGNRQKYSLQDIKYYLDENWAKKIMLDNLAEMFFINKFYLTRLFKTQYGVSIIDYVLEKRITNAKKLLRFTDKTVENVGMECGFDDANYFSRMFRNVEGIPPLEYRRSWDK
ncbi:MAG: helix-turn-helix domain-containing protein [Eubacteriales bacterium]|nr:helix-turn-helix domain-containing protein [Eubacteriales bacterium]